MIKKTKNGEGKKIQQTRILIVDDHPIVRRGLAELISDEEDLEVCGEASDIHEALKLVDEVLPQLVIIDISLKNGNGIDLIKSIKNRDQKIKMLVSSMHDETLYAERVLRAGAMGYINKAEVTDKMIEAIRHVLKDEVYLSPRMTDQLLQRTFHLGKKLAATPFHDFSDRELEVFEMIGNGLTTRQIASNLKLSIKTVETYRENIKTRLNLKNGAELAMRAVKWVLEKGILDASPPPPPDDVEKKLGEEV